MKTHYEILEINESATKDEIKKAYKRLAKRYHPDKLQNKNEDKFKEINNSYNFLLKNINKKDTIEHQYDINDYIYKNFENLKTGTIKNPIFEFDIFLHIKISIQDAINGVSVKYNHKNGIRYIKIPANTGLGEIIRIPKFGIRTKTRIGDMYVKIHIKNTKSIKVVENNHILIKHKVCPLSYLLNKETESIKFFNEEFYLKDLNIFNNNKIRIRKKGLFFNNKKERGDLFITLSIDYIGAIKKINKFIFSGIKNLINKVRKSFFFFNT